MERDDRRIRDVIHDTGPGAVRTINKLDQRVIEVNFLSAIDAVHFRRNASELLKRFSPSIEPKIRMKQPRGEIYRKERYDKDRTKLAHLVNSKLNVTIVNDMLALTGNTGEGVDESEPDLVTSLYQGLKETNLDWKDTDQKTAQVDESLWEPKPFVYDLDLAKRAWPTDENFDPNCLHQMMRMLNTPTENNNSDAVMMHHDNFRKSNKTVIFKNKKNSLSESYYLDSENKENI